YGDGNGEVALAGVTPPVTFDHAPGSATESCASTGTDSSGICTVIISNSTADTFVANASFTFTTAVFPGLSEDFTRDTAGTSGPGGSGAATKVFVDGAVAIAPNGINEVGNSH